MKESHVILNIHMLSFIFGPIFKPELILIAHQSRGKPTSAMFFHIHTYIDTENHAPQANHLKNKLNKLIHKQGNCHGPRLFLVSYLF